MIFFVLKLHYIDNGQVRRSLIALLLGLFRYGLLDEDFVCILTLDFCDFSKFYALKRWKTPELALLSSVCDSLFILFFPKLK